MISLKRARARGGLQDFSIKMVSSRIAKHNVIQSLAGGIVHFAT